MKERTHGRAEWWLKLLLRLNGVLALGAVGAVVMPHAWLAWCVGKVDPDLPVGPLVSYLARMLSAFFVLLGVMLLVFATDVRRYARPIRWAMLWCYFAAGVLLVHAAANFELLADQWFFRGVAADGLIGLAMCSAILLLQRGIAREQAE